MTIGIISESPSLTTGFARTTRIIGEALLNLGHSIHCFGIGVWGENFDRQRFPYPIWGCGEFSPLIAKQLFEFVESVSPDCVFVQYDLITAATIIELLRAGHPNIKIVTHVVIDALPVYPQLLAMVGYSKCVLAPTECSCAVVRRVVHCPVFYLPHYVNNAIFNPRLRKTSFGKRPIIGSIATNRARKQLIQTLHAIKLLASEGVAVDLLLHTDRVDGTKSGGHRLDLVVGSLGLNERVALSLPDGSIHSENHEAWSQWRQWSYVERIANCDVGLVSSSHGGFEYSIIEFQACGVPVCSTNDGGNLKEVAGGATRLLEPVAYDLTDYGGKICRLNARSIADGIIDALNQNRSAQLRRQGLQNVERYSIEGKQNELCTVLTMALLTISNKPHSIKRK